MFLLGEPGSTKTTTIVNSALDPDLLAAHVYQDNNVLPTRVANIWYSRAALFVDPAGNLLFQPSRWRRLVKLVQPGRVSSAVGKRQQAPRVAIVCLECESFVKQGASEATLSAARKLGTRLQEISQMLGISFPVYVLFTKLDRVSFFLDYVRGLSREEVSQVLGATVPVRSLATGIDADIRRPWFRARDLGTGLIGGLFVGGDGPVQQWRVSGTVITLVAACQPIGSDRNFWQL